MRAGARLAAAALLAGVGAARVLGAQGQNASPALLRAMDTHVLCWV